MFTSLDTSGTWNVNRSATKTSTRDTYSALSGSKNFILAKNWSQDLIFVVTSILSILSMYSKFSTGHAFHLFKLIFSVVTSLVLLTEEEISKNKKKKSKNPKIQRQSKNREKRERQKWNNTQRSTQRSPFERYLRELISALFLIIFLLFTSLDKSGTWNVNRPTTKTSTWNTYSALPGLEKIILAKNWSQDLIFVVTSFLSILNTSSEFSIGHTFHLFNLIFSMGTPFMLLSEEKISKK